MKQEAFDIIGDIHGEAPTLEQLLGELGYRADLDDVYRHPERRVIFLGDFVDRGRHQKRVVDLVRRMVDAGTAMAVMGNHEFNAIAYGTPDEQGGWLRLHSRKNAQQCEAFLGDYPFGSAAHADVLNWFRALPLWLDLGGLRIVHACWDPIAIALLTQEHSGPRLTDELLHAASDKAAREFRAVETLLKGKEIPLPAGASFSDKDGNVRHDIRIRWWDASSNATYRDLYMGPAHAVSHIPDDTVEGDHAIEYGHSEPPIFLGHYWMQGEPEPLASNVACLDYSVARRGGHLVAYRWDGERALDREKFVAVERVEEVPLSDSL